MPFGISCWQYLDQILGKFPIIYGPRLPQTGNDQKGEYIETNRWTNVHNQIYYLLCFAVDSYSAL